MKIAITATEKLTNVNGVPMRVWDGVTESGKKCFVFVHVVAVHNSENQEEFKRELIEHMPAGKVFDMRQIL